MRAALLAVLAVAVGCGGSVRPSARPSPLPSPEVPGERENRVTPAVQGEGATARAAVASKVDLWGEGALKAPGGPSFDYFDKLVPPIRYVDADFRVYPINLSAPLAKVKARVLGDGSVINALAHQPNWRNEAGIPMRVLVGEGREVFGKNPEKLEGPKFVDGFLPIVKWKYQGYGEDIFAMTDEGASASGAVMARFDFPDAAKGRVELRLEDGYGFLPGDAGDVVRDATGKLLLAFDPACFQWNRYRSALETKPNHAKSGVVIVFTIPADAKDLSSLGTKIEAATTKPAMSPAGEKSLAAKAGNTDPPAGPPGEIVQPKMKDVVTIPLNVETYEKQRKACVEAWRKVLAQGARVRVPEQYVNSAWRGLVVSSFMIAVGDRMNYSAGNQYARQYVAEGGDAIRAMLLFGQVEDAKKWVGPILEYERPNMGFHNAGLKLQLLAQHYWVTRDKAFVENSRAQWERELKVILDARDPATGLLPREKYCGDIDDLVVSLNSAAISWRGVRDMAAVLQDVGDTSRAKQLRDVSNVWRKQLQDAVHKAAVKEDDALYIPTYPGEPVHDPITATRLGSYWNLISGYLIGSGLFRYDSPEMTGLLKWLQEKGGLCMGMLRVQSAPSFWVGRPTPQNIDDLYGTRYALKLQERDEADRALVSFYGKLAQGMTRDTYEDGESTSIQPVDRWGRQVYLPPNTAANGSFLQQLRGLLVQDLDLDDDGKPETLRLCFATPRAWMEDGKEMVFERMPTAFGNVSVHVKSEVKGGKVTARVSLPDRNPIAKTLLKLRVPEGYQITGATIGDKPVSVSKEVIDLTGSKGEVTVIAQVAKR